MQKEIFENKDKYKEVNVTDNKYKKNVKKLGLIFILVMFVIIYIISISKLNLQNDTLFDIKLGEQYLNHGVVTEDTFSIHSGLKYVSHHFIVNIITYCIYNFSGFFGLYILEIFLTCLLAICFYVANRQFLKSKVLSYLFVFLQLFLMTPFISIRAQMYSYILFLLEIIFIERFLKTSKKSYIILLCLLPILIVNFHAGMLMLYFVIIGTYFCNLLKISFFKVCIEDKQRLKNTKYLFIPFIFGLFAGLMNPFGIDLLVYGLKTLSNSFINSTISEFRPVNIKSFIGEIMYIYSFLIITSFCFTKKKIKLHHALFFVGTMFMGLFSSRHFGVMVICTITCLSYLEDILYEIREKMYKGLVPKGKIAINVTGCVMFGICFLYLSVSGFLRLNREYLPAGNYPHNAVKYIKENIGQDKRIFNDYNYGTLLMFNNIPPFIDSRCDLYTQEYNKGCNVAMDYKTASTCSGDYSAVLKKYNIDYVFMGKEKPLVNAMANNDKFEQIYSDNECCIYKIIK
ncbi:MAG: hypothetical protein RSE57_03580 [Clostridia bacterium]